MQTLFDLFSRSQRIMGFASFNFSEYGNSVQHILVSLEVRALDYVDGCMCLSLSRPSWSVSARAALRSRRAPCPRTAAQSSSLRQVSPCRRGADPVHFLRSGTSYFRSDRTHEFDWWKWKCGVCACRPFTRVWRPHISRYAYPISMMRSSMST